MLTLAPLSLPTMITLVVNEVLVPNNVLTVVAVKLIVEPTTVLDTLVPNVSVVFKLVAAALFDRDWETILH